MDLIDGIIVGAAAAAIGTIVAMKYLNPTPPGGSQPNQPMLASYNAMSSGAPGALYVTGYTPTPGSAAPLQQTIPITEAAYNQQPIVFEAAFGPSVNQPAEEAVVPQ